MWVFSVVLKNFLAVFNTVKQNEYNNFVPFHLYAKGVACRIDLQFTSVMKYTNTEFLFFFFRILMSVLI